MDNQERAFSPAKPLAASSDHYPRSFYGAVTDQQTYHDDTSHGPLPIQVTGGYGIGGSSHQAYPIPPAGSVHPQSSGFHHQVGPALHPQPTVGLLRPSAQPLPLTVTTPQTGGGGGGSSHIPQNVPPPVQAMTSQSHIAQMYPWIQQPTSGGGGGVPPAPSTESQMSQTVQQQQQFQRLKVEDALSYLDQVFRLLLYVIGFNTIYTVFSECNEA